MKRQQVRGPDGEHPSMKFDTEWLLAITSPAGTTTERIGRHDIAARVRSTLQRLLSERGGMVSAPWPVPPFGWAGSIVDAEGVRIDVMLRMVPVVNT
ncbi:MAG: hypothetical protein Q8S13_01630 [Dehalococcoidia bacterium]|nr:hypothetical protein [Dehalococcoidia bacterium]